MQIVPGSQQYGIINQKHFLSEKEEATYVPKGSAIELEAEAGEARADDGDPNVEEEEVDDRS